MNSPEEEHKFKSHVLNEINTLLNSLKQTGLNVTIIRFIRLREGRCVSTSTLRMNSMNCATRSPHSQ